jgi:hypothetical protein
MWQVELTVERGDGSPAFVDQQNGGLERKGVIEVSFSKRSPELCMDHCCNPSFLLEHKLEAVSW